MAEGIDKALRQIEKGVELKSKECKEEDDFEKMFAALGDKQTQSNIRQDNPEGTHCSLLLINPSACDGCKNNPYEGETKKETKKLPEEELLLLKYERDIEYGLYLYDLIEMRLISDLKELSPREIAIVRVIHKHSKALRARGAMLGLL